MISLRRATERHYYRRENRDVWLTFYPHEPHNAQAYGFGALESLNEVSLAPGARVRRATSSSPRSPRPATLNSRPSKRASDSSS
jgi:hypothetical protein